MPQLALPVEALADDPDGRPVVFLLCGLTGSGKTVLAQALEKRGIVRLSLDEEVFARHGRYGIDYPEHEYFQREAPIAEELRQRLVTMIASGASVVLDQGLWRRAQREEYKRLVEQAGGAWRLIYLRADRALLLSRLAERNRRADANALTVTESALEDFHARFDEPDGEDEIVVTPPTRTSEREAAKDVHR